MQNKCAEVHITCAMGGKSRYHVDYKTRIKELDVKCIQRSFVAIMGRSVVSKVKVSKRECQNCPMTK